MENPFASKLGRAPQSARNFYFLKPCASANSSHEPADENSSRKNFPHADCRRRNRRGTIYFVLAVAHRKKNSSAAGHARHAARLFARPAANPARRCAGGFGRAMGTGATICDFRISCRAITDVESKSICRQPRRVAEIFAVPVI